jgi:hypothetical protein
MMVSSMIPNYLAVACLVVSLTVSGGCDSGPRDEGGSSTSAGGVSSTSAGGGSSTSAGDSCEEQDHYECLGSNGNILWFDCDGNATGTQQRCCTGCSSGAKTCPVPADENNCCPGEDCDSCEEQDHYECLGSNGNILWFDCDGNTTGTQQRCCTGCSSGAKTCPVPADENNCCPGEDCE